MFLNVSKYKNRLLWLKKQKLKVFVEKNNNLIFEIKKINYYY